MLTPPPPPHDRPSWERGRVVSVPRHDLSTDWNSKVSNFSQMSLPLSFQIFQNSNSPPKVKHRLRQVGHRFLEFLEIRKFLNCL